MTTTTLTMHGFGSTSSSTSGEASGPHTLDQISSEHRLSYDPRFIHATTDLRPGYDLVDRIEALSEPWRSRFVDLVTQRAGVPLSCESPPPRTQLAVWLSDQQLSRMIQLMLRTWTHRED
ncbi:MAG: hypothetical protein MUQ30_13005 [Anaerolineae bacterium]|nr:hypothetical protein [Anaerolineae bacterium]